MYTRAYVCMRTYGFVLFLFCFVLPPQFLKGRHQSKSVEPANYFRCPTGSLAQAVTSVEGAMKILVPPTGVCSRHPQKPSTSLKKVTQNYQVKHLHIFFLLLFFCVHSHSSEVRHFGWDFCRMWQFFNPTMEVATFRLRGWCMLGVFLLPVFARRGRECHDLLGSCDGRMCAQTRPGFISNERVFVE